MNFGPKENIKCTKKYLVDNGIIKESYFDTIINDKDYYEEQILKF